jgi:tRNA A-37 threonylcarbamoyl transferase component Bud32/pimeloyl-ACP methyl ester carboxylesterase
MTDQLRAELEASLGPTLTLGDELGGGGMSRVFRARDERLQRDIVVKVLSPDLTERLSVERFTREIRLAAALQEPHIVPVFDAGHTGSGLPYYTMPFVRGESLRARIERGGPLALREGVAVLRDVAHALAFAHARGVIHRDIKPENVLLSGSTAVVADFGIAKALVAARGEMHSRPAERARDATELTQLGTAIGTPAYMAPEQAAADPAVDHRADLYAWGLLAYEAFAGRHPFARHTTPQALLVAQLTERPAPPDTLRPDLPAPIVDVVMRCLEKDPALRPRDATELLDALDAGKVAVGLPVRRHVAERTFRLSETVCRRLDRASLDPRMIGDVMHYLENDAPTGVLALCIHGMGNEAAEFTALMESSPYRVIAPTFYGFEPVVEHARVPLPVEAHVALVRELLRDAVTRLAPTRVVLVGFSSGADVAIRMLTTAPPDAPRVDACLALGPNLSLATCFVSRVLARVQGGEAAAVLADLRQIGEDAHDLDEWMNVMAYLLHALRKFRGDLSALCRFADGIQRPFAEHDDTFAEWFRVASERVDVLRCVFERSETCTRLVQALRLRNLDDGSLGARYDDGSLVLESTENHLALVEPARIAAQLDATVAELAVRGRSINP